MSCKLLVCFVILLFDKSAFVILKKLLKIYIGLHNSLINADLIITIILVH